MLDFLHWFNTVGAPKLGGGHSLSLSFRDILAWAAFVAGACKVPGAALPAPATALGAAAALLPWQAFVHGAALVLLDGLGLGTGMSRYDVAQLHAVAAEAVVAAVPFAERAAARLELFEGGGEVHVITLPGGGVGVEDARSDAAGVGADGVDGGWFGMAPFLIRRGPLPAAPPAALRFSLGAPTTARNLRRVLRAMQLRKAVLLEGSPGVGKSSLVAALAAAAGHRLVRINLSEQTDVSDLMGSDLPMPDAADDGGGDGAGYGDCSNAGAGADGGNAGGGGGGNAGGGGGGGARFMWQDGVFLRALKDGDWVLLDELNLASQSVLEALNACLDHRAEVFIPELNRTFRCPAGFRVFAAQNPLGQGGGRKGLPKSFLNRFTRVYVESLTSADMLHIAAARFPAIAEGRVASCRGDIVSDATAAADELAAAAKTPLRSLSLLMRMIAFNRQSLPSSSRIQHDTTEARAYGRHGAPWEFNLRDVFRWCELMVVEQGGSGAADASKLGGAGGASFSSVKAGTPEMAAATPVPAEEDGLWESLGLFPDVKVTPTEVTIGSTVLKRGRDASAVSSGMSARLTALPLSLRRPLHALARAVAMGWPALVVGRRASGKTAVVTALAAAAGMSLRRVAVTPATDVTELLGCFEQV
ncbi:unnamed protein product, partial [Phaeothamnion confervicola]